MKKWIPKFAAVLLLSGSFAFGQTGGGGTGTGGGGVRVTGTPAANDCAKFVNSNTITTAGAACGTGSGGVTSVSFTGGLISVGTPTTTPALTVAGTSGGVPYFDTATSWNTSALLTANSPILGGGAGTAPKTATFLTTNGTSELDIGVIGGGNGALGLKGNTSGIVTFTAPAVAGTSTNPIIISNAIESIAGSATNPAYVFSSNTGSGMWQDPSGGYVGISQNGSVQFAVDGVGVRWQDSGQLRWCSTFATTCGDTVLSRASNGVVRVGAGTNDNSGSFSASGYIAGGISGVSSSGILCSGTFTSVDGIVTACTAVSDQRVKTGIHPFGRGLEAIMALQPATYRMNKEGQKITGFPAGREQSGFVAQNVRNAIPEAVGMERHDGVDYLSLPEGDRPIVAALVNAVKEQQVEIEQLRAQVKRLQAE